MLAGSVDVVVLVDVLSFSTAVEIATSRGASVYPYRWNDDSAAAFARQIGAVLAGPRGQGGLSVSPASFIQIEAGTKVVLASRNGAALSLLTGQTHTLMGCLRNAEAVARAAGTFGVRVGVVPAGERWPDGTLRPSLEDSLAAGAIIRHLNGARSPEAEAAVTAYEHCPPNLEAILRSCVSGRQLIEQGCDEDVALASEIGASTTVPMLVDRAYIRFSLP